jgi:uncharacterized protein YgiM (DUF1202 family)
MHMNAFVQKLKHLSTAEKAAGVGVVALAAFLVYSHFKSSSAPVGLPAGGSFPTGLPSGLPSTSPGVPSITPVAYTGTSRSGGPTGYTVQTQTDNLMVRSGPGVNYAVIGQFVKGSTVIATGNLADGSGMTWAEVKTPNGQTGWSSTSYLTAIPSTVPA